MIGDRPRWAAEWHALATAAAHLHAQRAARYPAAIEKGAITADAAAVGIRIAAAIAADWRHVATLAPREAGPEASKAERIDTLTAALRQTRAKEGKAGEQLPKLARRYIGDPGELATMNDRGWFGAGRPLVTAYLNAAEHAELIETLLWWERQPFDHLFAASLNIAAGVRRAVPAEARAA
ncbi:MAG: hypothetical protein QHC65_14170 [Sphingomonas sp.]|nr:hypothetical protein [Sphingomonas sp.]MDX3885563.1 hypothetical protein [Sphingomonas sp.]